LLRVGAIGTLREVEIETLRIQDCAAADPDHPNWRRDPAMAGGGVLMDHGWHADLSESRATGSARNRSTSALHSIDPLRQESRTRQR
jgi:hypothetical protein